MRCCQRSVIMDKEAAASSRSKSYRMGLPPYTLVSAAMWSWTRIILTSCRKSQWSYVVKPTWQKSLEDEYSSRREYHPLSSYEMIFLLGIKVIQETCLICKYEPLCFSIDVRIDAHNASTLMTTYTTTVTACIMMNLHASFMLSMPLRNV